MMENKKMAKGSKARQSKKINSTVEPIIVDLGAKDLYREFLIAREKAGGKLNFEERIYLWNSMLREYGITLIADKPEVQVKQSWLKRLTRWIKSLTNKC